MLRIRLNKVIKCLFVKSFPTFNTSFINILSMPGALFAFNLHIAVSNSSSDIKWSSGPVSFSLDFLKAFFSEQLF